MATKSDIQEIKFNKWDNGMPDCQDERDLNNGWYEYLENVTTGDNTKVLKQVSDVTGTTNSRAILKSYSGADGTIYSLGSDGGNFSMYYNSGTWHSLAMGSAKTFENVVNPFFVEYQGNIYLYGGLQTNGFYLYRYVIGNSNNPPVAILTSVTTISGNTLPLQGGVEWQGNLYGWIGKDIYKVTTAGVITKMLTIPTDQTIVDLVSYGNLLAIITNGVNENNMYLWDGVTTTSFYDIVKIGVGTVVGGVLRNGIITVVMNSLSGESFRILEYNGNFRVVFYYNGRKNNSGTINTYVISRVKLSRGFIYFLGSVTRPNSTDTRANVLFRWGNKVTGTANALCVYKNLNFASTNLTGFSQNLNDFLLLDDIYASPDYVSVFATLMDASGTPVIKEVKTDGTYNNDTGIVETGIYNCGDGSINKQLKAVSLQYTGLTGTGVTMYLRGDNGTAWIQIFADNTVGSMSHEAVNIESTGSNLPTFKEIQFRIEMIGGQTLTGGKFKWELTHNVYGD